MTANRDIMSVALAAVYGPDNNLADWEAQHWVAEGFEPCGPGDKAAWYAAEGASGTSYGDLEYDYWSNVYAGGGGGGVAPSNTVAPALDVSTLTAGGTVTVSDGTWTGDATITYTYQWQSSPTGLGSWTNIGGATSDSLVSTETQVDTWVRCVVTGTNGVGNSSANSDTCAIQHVFTTLGGTWWIDAAREVASGASTSTQWALNRGNQAVPHARLGSSGRAELRGSYGLVLPGVTANGAQASGNGGLPVTKGLDLIVRVAPADWTPAAAMNLIGEDAAGSNEFYWQIDTAGTMSLVTNAGTSTSTAAVGAADGSPLWLRCLLTPNGGGAGVYRVQFFTAADAIAVPSSWTQLGSNVDFSGSVLEGANPITVGARRTTGVSPFTGSIYRAIIRNQTDGVTVFDADFTAATAFATSFTESSSNAATVTINATSGADTNDPLLLPHTGTNYLYLPGIIGNFPSWSMTQPTSIEYVLRVAAADWTPSSASVLALCGAGSYLGVKADGTLEFQRKTGGSTTYWASTAATGFTDGATYWVRCTYDASTGDVKFYTAADQSTEPSSWTQLGTTRAAGAGSLDTASTSCDIGRLTGSYYRVIIRDAASGGNTIFDANLAANTNQSSFTESSANAATVTINRASSGRKSVMVTRPVWLFGTDDYMEVADNEAFTATASDSFTVLTVVREHATPGSYSTLASQRAISAVGDGWIMQHNGTAFQLYARIQDGAATKAYSSGGTWSAGVVNLVGMIRRVSDDTLTTFVGSTIAAGTSDTTTDTINSTMAMQIGKDTAGTSYLDGEVLAVAYFRSALDSTALGQIASYFGV